MLSIKHFADNHNASQLQCRGPRMRIARFWIMLSTLGWFRKFERVIPTRFDRDATSRVCFDLGCQAIYILVSWRCLVTTCHKAIVCFCWTYQNWSHHPLSTTIPDTSRCWTRIPITEHNFVVWDVLRLMHRICSPKCLFLPTLSYNPVMKVLGSIQDPRLD